MAYDGKLLAQAREKLEHIRADNQSEHARRLSEVYGRIPEVAALDGRLREHMSTLVRLTLARPADLEERLAALREENLTLQMRRAELLTEKGYSPAWLDELVSCPVCRDTGTVNGRVCACLKKLYNAELTRELGVLMRTGEESFENFSLSVYDEEPLPGSSTSPRAAMTLVYNLAKKYAENFSPASRNLLFQGGTGLGKTYLSACIARTVAGKGYSVCYDSASGALDAFETKKFSRDTVAGEEAAARVQRMLSCDLLILDDLGTEMPTPMAVSALYSLLNTRLVNRRPTVISTNLSDGELESRYTPQIASRISGEFLHLSFIGRDIRKNK